MKSWSWMINRGSFEIVRNGGCDLVTGKLVLGLLTQKLLQLPATQVNKGFWFSIFIFSQVCATHC